MISSEYHYVITVQAPAPGGMIARTFQGTIDFPGERISRQDVYYDRFDYACDQLGSDAKDTVVLFWSCDRDTM